MVKAGGIGTGGGFNLRHTGILPLDLLPWGAHICLFYRTPQDLIDANAGFFRAGLADNEFCFWVMSDQVDRDSAIAGLREQIAGFDEFLAAGAIELVSGDEWYRRGEPLDVQDRLGSWRAKLEDARSHGFAGMRASGNAFWMEANLWRTFREYEEELDEALSGTAMIVLCTYKLGVSWAADLLAVARVHQFSIVLQDGKWEFLETPELAAARRDAGRLNDVIQIPSGPFPGHDRLTPREHATLAQIVNGASNKEAARALGISPRTVEFHRANVMRKLDARSVAQLVSIVLGIL